MPEPYSLLRRLDPQSLLFEARNVRTARPVVVQLVAGLDEAELIRRLGDSPQLSHANTVRLLDAGVVEDPVRVGYVVREHVRGTSLAEHLRQHRPLSVRAAVRIVWQVLGSLTEAHRLGIVHGRLAPEHVLLQGTKDGVPHVKVAGYWSFSGRAGVPEYRPDDVDPEALALDATSGVRADLYACAKLLLDCLGSGPELSALERAPELRTILQRVLSTDAADRLTSAADVRGALAGCAWGTVDPREDNRDVLSLGKSKPYSELSLSPPRDSLMSTRAPLIWVLEGDPSLTTPPVRAALKQLSARYSFRGIARHEQGALMEELRHGRQELPWVVIFGGVDVSVDGALLALLSTSAELCRLLVSSDQNLELLQKGIAQGGLDRHLCLPCDAAELVDVVQSLMVCTRRSRNHYDSVRIALYKARDEVGRLSRAIAAGHERASSGGVGAAGERHA